MEFPSIDNSAAAAKRADRDGIKSYQLARDKFHAYIAATLDPALVPWARGIDRTGDVEADDDDELVSVPARPQPVPVPRRQRKRPLAKVIEAARKAGADRIVVDGTTIMLSAAAAVPVAESSTVADPDANEWDNDPH